jgi:hypothetical protein
LQNSAKPFLAPRTRWKISHRNQAHRILSSRSLWGLFNNMINYYFSRKEEAILAYGIDRAARVREALRARPAAKTFRKNPNQFRFDAHGLTLLAVGRSR